MAIINGTIHIDGLTYAWWKLAKEHERISRMEIPAEAATLWRNAQRPSHPGCKLYDELRALRIIQSKLYISIPNIIKLLKYRGFIEPEEREYLHAGVLMSKARREYYINLVAGLVEGRHE